VKGYREKLGTSKKKKKKKKKKKSLGCFSSKRGLRAKLEKKKGLISDVRCTWVGFRPICRKNLTRGLNCNFLKLQGGKLPILKL
jgi:hypothetical protein